MLQSSALPSDIPKKPEVSLAKPGVVNGSEKKPSIHANAPPKAGVRAQPARWLSPHNHLSLSQILQQRCLQLQSQILVVNVSPPCADVVLNLLEVFETQAHITKDGEGLPHPSPAWGPCWSWASPAAVSDITVFLCCVCLRTSWTAQEQ